MPKSHPPYPPKFQRQMVELVRAGRNPEELAKEFEPAAQAIRNWVAQADRDAGRRDDGLTSAEREELRRLRGLRGLVLKHEEHEGQVYILQNWAWLTLVSYVTY